MSYNKDLLTYLLTYITLVLYGTRNKALVLVSLTSTRAESGTVCFHYHYSCDISIVQELSVLDYTIVFIMKTLLKHIWQSVESVITLKILWT